jgi:hypothetical protein
MQTLIDFDNEAKYSDPLSEAVSCRWVADHEVIVVDSGQSAAQGRVPRPLAYPRERAHRHLSVHRTRMQSAPLAITRGNISAIHDRSAADVAATIDEGSRNRVSIRVWGVRCRCSWMSQNGRGIRED